ncbi:MAG: SusC/RagA family TonB-linked outer membrane protein, partial [Aquaticitalea sp.]
MRLVVFLCCLSSFSFTPNVMLSQNAKVTIKVDATVTVDDVFDLIMKQTDYKFIYQEGIFENFPKVNLKKGTIRTDNLLERSLSAGNFKFEFNANNTIVIQTAEPIKLSFQEREVTGTLTDKTGMPIAGATVIVEGTNRGVVTNFDGIYKIVMKAGENVLVFSSLGYKTERIVVGEQTVVNLIFQEDFSQLDEIVLIGYGEQKREDVTTAISSIKKEDIVQAAIGSVGFDRSLGGLVAGLSVSQSTGRPGAEVNINIRGYTSPFSPGTNQPLFVIDGVPFNVDGLPGANPLLTINPNDIESVDVLKDAGATAIYGSRGANGVIIVSTKKGKRNQTPKMNLSYTTTLARPIATVDVLDAKQYRAFYDTLIQSTVNAMNAGQLDPFFAFDLANIGLVDIDFDTFQVSYDGLRDDYFGDADTDWNKEVFRSVAVTKQANLSVQGGSESTNYSFSGSFIDQEGLTIKDGLKQYTLSTSLDSDIGRRLRIGGKVNVGHAESNSGEDDLLGQYSVNTSIARARPDLPVYDENGELLPQLDFAYGAFPTLEPNPLMRLQNKTTNKSYNFLGNGYVEIEPIKDLKLKADVNAAVFYTDNSSFVPKTTQTQFPFFDNVSYLSENSTLVSNVTTNLTANYAFRFGEHKFNALGGFAWDRTNFDTKSQFYSGFPDDEVLINGTSAENVLGYSSDRTETGLNSFFSRLTYNYKNRYNLTLNFRSDASSKFGPDNKRAYFPSASAGWNIANEDFLSDNKTFNVLRLRASAGRVGSTNTRDFAYLQFFQTTSSNAYAGSSAVVPNNNFPNRNIGWEETEEINLGFDFEL